MIVASVPRESLIRLLLWIGGVLTTIVGAWISSKIHVYHENRKAHLEDIKQKVLLPLGESLTENFTALVAHRVPVVADKWGTWHRKERPSVTEYPTEQGPVLLSASPKVIPAVDQAFFADARKRHFRRLMQTIEDFLAAWDEHAKECHDWVQKLSDEILAVSELPKHPGQIGSPYVMQYRLGVFIYQRLCCNLERALSAHQQNPAVDYWVLEGFDGASAAGTKKQLDDLLGHLDGLILREQDTASRLLKSARVLEQRLIVLRNELSYAAAARRLRHRCDLVPFF